MSTFETLIKLAIQDALSYDDYMVQMQNLVDNAVSSGIEQSEFLAHYTLLNFKRMQRLNKTLKISETQEEAIKQDSRSLIYLVLTESWCGDAAQSIPVWAKVAALQPNSKLLLVSRDSHEALMSLFLTAGAKSIPIVLAIDAQTLKLLFQWGPRPSTLTQMVLDFKATHGTLTHKFKEDLQLWYNKDKGQTTLKDLLGLLGLGE